MFFVLRLLAIPVLLTALLLRYGLLQPLIRRSERLSHISRRIQIVAFAYVAAILISAALRIFGLVDWS